MELLDKHGQIISPDITGGLVITPHPLTLAGQRLIESDLIPGETLKEFLGRHVPDLENGNWVVSINGHEVPEAMWAKTMPKDGVVIECRSVARREALRMIAIVVLAYYTMGAGGLGEGGLFAAGGAIGGGVLAAASVYVEDSIVVSKATGGHQ